MASGDGLIMVEKDYLLGKSLIEGELVGVPSFF